MIPDDIIEEIRTRAPIAEIVGEYVTLKKSGSSYRGLCPFHNEKTPSFYVHPNRGFYHCFGCKASGDAFSFLVQLEGRSFPEVARQLAERVGVELPERDPAMDARQRQHKALEDRLSSVMEAAANFFVKQLAQNPHASAARDELNARGIQQATAKEFRLGYAPAAWDALARHLEQSGASLEDAQSAGLIVQRRGGGGYYDRFRNRLMFPITDLHARVVAFSGRALPTPEGVEAPREKPAKYINSPESPLYKKGQMLFGLHEARVQIRRESSVILCEGNFDLIALHQAGFDHAVAPLGTAFTVAQARLLKRFAQTAILLFDGDAAGQKAIREALPVVQEVGIVARVVALPEGMDPDSYLRGEGADALKRCIDEAPNLVDFLIDLNAQEAAADPQAKARAIASLGPVLARIESPVERQLYVERVARKFGLSDLKVVRQELRRGLRSHKGMSQNTAPRSSRAPENTLNTRLKAPELPPLQSQLISLVIDQPTLVKSDEGRKLQELLTSDDLRVIFESILEMVETRETLDAVGLLRRFEQTPMYSWLEARLALQKHDFETASEMLRKGLPRLAKNNIEQELPELQQRIVKARQQGDDAKASELTEQFVSLSRSAHKLM